ncbi:MAG: hypothetical protein Fur0010_23420 [Bdellovibrio sp.]
MTKKWALLFAMWAGLFSCAGPMTPFGSIGLFDSSQEQNRIPASDNSLLLPSEMKSSQAEIKFLPSRQKFHDKQNLTVVITDPDMILPISRIRVLYNDRDVTNSFLSRATIKLTENNQTMKISFDFLRLPAHKNHHITIKYQRDHFTRPLWNQFLPPYCHVQEDLSLGDIKRFNVDREIKNLITEETKLFKYNPNFLAGLIAQESGFDNRAVSRARAMGLTQITPLAAKEIDEVSGAWPQYPGVETMPLWRLKQLINEGEINHENEWRLDHRRSIVGGLTYLKYVESYWHDQKNLLEQVLPQYQNFWEDLVLASYNSEPTRVKGALLDMGSYFLDHKDLNEARKYVNNVKSYCYEFSHQGEGL